MAESLFDGRKSDQEKTFIVVHRRNSPWLIETCVDCQENLFNQLKFIRIEEQVTSTGFVLTSVGRKFHYGQNLTWVDRKLTWVDRNSPRPKFTSIDRNSPRLTANSPGLIETHLNQNSSRLTETHHD